MALPFAEAFDRTGALRRPSLKRLPGEVLSLVSKGPPRPDPSTLPNGGGRPVLVVPAFLTDDGFMRELRDYLDRCGFRSFAWNIGINWGPTDQILAALRKRLMEVLAVCGTPISLVGVSLGGLLARDLAHDHPNNIAHVVTVASTIRLPTATALEPLIRLCGIYYSSKLDLNRVGEPLPVPSTTIYSRDDGIVPWQSCVAEELRGVSIEVSGPHLSMCRNPEALKAIVSRLAL